MTLCINSGLKHAPTSDGSSASTDSIELEDPEPEPDQTFTLDLSDPTNPVLHDQIEIKERPDSVSVSHDGRWLAIAYNNKGAGSQTPIGIYRIRDGKVVSQNYPEIADFDAANNHIISAKWHPSENTLAMINETRATVFFGKVQASGNTVTLERWGNEVSTGKAPFIGRFTNDGKHFIVNNLYWGPDVKGRWTEAPASTIVNIRLAHFEKDGEPVHAMSSQVLTRSASEGFAVSPDGSLVAAVNMERSWLPYEDERQSWFSSITLIHRDPETGQMFEGHTTPYYSVLPEMAVFDASGKYLAVVNYDHYNHDEPGGSVDFFKLVKDPLNKKPKMLVQTRYSVPVQHGAHDMILVD